VKGNLSTPWIQLSLTAFGTVVTAALSALLLGACSTHRASMPEVARSAVAASAQPVGLSRVRDARANSEVGRLGVGGAITMTSGTELTTYIFDYPTSQLAARGFNAVLHQIQRIEQRLQTASKETP